MKEDSQTAGENLGEFGQALISWAPEWGLLFSFLEKSIGHLAWPVVVLIVLSRFREPLISVISKIRHIKWKDAELAFGEEVRKLSEESKNLEPATSNIASRNRVAFERIMRIVERSPRDAVMQAYMEVERSLRRLIEEDLAQQSDTHLYSSKFYSSKKMPVFRLARELGRAEQEMFHSLRKLRNRVAHEADVKISEAEAIQYILLADKLVDSVNQIVEGDT